MVMIVRYGFRTRCHPSQTLRFSANKAKLTWLYGPALEMRSNIYRNSRRRKIMMSSGYCYCYCYWPLHWYGFCLILSPPPMPTAYSQHTQVESNWRYWLHKRRKKYSQKSLTFVSCDRLHPSRCDVASNLFELSFTFIPTRCDAKMTSGEVSVRRTFDNYSPTPCVCPSNIRCKDSAAGVCPSHM